MNFLSGYGSDDDELSFNENKTSSHKPYLPSNNTTVNKDQNKASIESGKKKIEILNLLPSNIQAALQGNTSYDSDSDDGGDSFTKKNPYEKTNIKSSSSSLLNLLPKAKDVGGQNQTINSLKDKSSLPKNGLDHSSNKNLVDQNMSKPNNNSIISTQTTQSKFALPLDSGPPKIYFVGKTQVEKKIESKPLGGKETTDKSDKFSPQKESGKNYKDESNEIGKSESLFTFENDSISSHKVDNDPIQYSSYPTPVPAPNFPTKPFGRMDDRDLLSGLNNNQYQNDDPHSNHYSQYSSELNNQLYAGQDTSNYIESETNQQLSGKKRDRRIEAELLNGNINIIEDKSYVVSGHSSWDKNKYLERQKNEEQVNNIYHFGGTNGGAKIIAQPTRLQNRKHQINSLAMAAANVELEMMEAKGARNKTKAETQAKYGW